VAAWMIMRTAFQRWRAVFMLERIINLSKAVGSTLSGQESNPPAFREAAPNGGFGVWWLSPPNPALAGNACRWATPIKIKLYA